MMHDGGALWPMGGVMLGWSLLTTILVALVVWVVVAQTRPRIVDGTETARRILSERYARGELDTEEYQRRLSALR